jgi:hypothetical protein
MTRHSKQFALSFPTGMYKQIEQLREDIPRSLYFRRMAEFIMASNAVRHT